MDFVQESLFQQPKDSRPAAPALPRSWGGKRAVVFSILQAAYIGPVSDWVPKYQIHDQVGDTMRNRISEVRAYLRTIGWTIENKMSRVGSAPPFPETGVSYEVWMSWYRIRPLHSGEVTS